jgi:hypothetical protein
MEAGPSRSATSPPYLASAPTAIKALKGAQDPPEAGWPSKIDIAKAVWQDENLQMLRKSEFLRDWILESWTRVSSKGKGKAVSE